MKRCRRKTFRKPAYMTGNAKTYSFKVGCDPNCECKVYCQMRMDAKHHREMCDAVQKAADSFTQGEGYYIPHPIHLQFFGLEIVLRSNNLGQLQAEINDTTGG